jgi:hypothetical protein
MSKDEDENKIPKKTQNKRIIGKPFTSEYQPESNGRKPLETVKAWKDSGLTREVFGIMIRYVASKSRDELYKIAADSELPFIACVIAKALLADFSKNNLTNFTVLTNRMFGTPHQSVSIEEPTKPDPIEELTHDQVVERIKTLLPGFLKYETKKTE